jgi:hypothetical protein
MYDPINGDAYLLDSAKMYRVDSLVKTLDK